MTEKPTPKPNRVIAAYDTETSNTHELAAFSQSYVVTHQIGILAETVELPDLTPANVESLCNVHLVRHTYEAYNIFHQLIELGKAGGFVPVVCVHNLGFDMYALSQFFDQFPAVQVCAKSTQMPLTLSPTDENGNRLITFWDTATFAGKSLATMGAECGYPKLSGAWDYTLIRTPETPLTAQEQAYATHDIYSLFAWLGYWCRMNETIDLTELAQRVLTKTSVVRVKTEQIAEKLYYRGARHNRMSVIHAWQLQNKQEQPKTDEELRLMHGCTRGGFTYVGSTYAGCPFELQDGRAIHAYDATSMHIFHGVGHYVPEHWHETTEEGIYECILDTLEVTPEYMLENYEKPFFSAFHARIKFTNLRLKGIFKRDGISTLASARFNPLGYKIDPEIDDNQQNMEALNVMMREGYRDIGTGIVKLFGKVQAADECVLLLNELSLWELSQVFEWDSIEPVGHGFSTLRYCKPTDKSVLAFNEMYKRKQIFKGVMHEYERSGRICGDLPGFIPGYILDGLRDGTADEADLDALYMYYKSDLNSLYGIEATNESRGNIVLTPDGLAMDTPGGTVDDLKENPKAWYQYGMRIVGWSRIHQLLFMLLTSSAADAYICGDTDSHKLVTSATPEQIGRMLQPLHDACTNAMERTTERVRRRWGADWYDMTGLGWYVHEWSTTRFHAAWNKCYCYMQDDAKLRFVTAGIPANARFTMPDGSVKSRNITEVGNYLMQHGYTFTDMANLLLSYNVELDHDVTGLNASKMPKWGTVINEEVTDYLGNTSTVKEPAMKTIYPMSKVIGDTMSEENYLNMLSASARNPALNTAHVVISWNEETDAPEFSIL